MTTVKVLDSNKEIAKYRFKKGEVLRLQAEKQVHYQLVDDATGRAPQNILAKRIGNDLHIALDEDNLDTDIIIENYYYLDKENAPDTENALVGLHENGRIYYYIPESGLENDAVSMLAEQVIKPQALGGEEIVAPFWFWNPWWIAGGLLAVGAGVALASGGGSKGKGNGGSAPANKLPTSPSVDFDQNANAFTIKMNTQGVENGDIAKFTLTTSEGNAVEVQYQFDASTNQWKILSPTVTYPEFDISSLFSASLPADGSFTLPASQVKVGEKITASTTDAVANKPSTPNEAIAPKTDVNPIPAAPTITPKEDGSVEVKLPENNVEDGDKVTIEFTRPDGTKDKAVLVKTPEGWAILGTPPKGVDFDLENGTVTLSDSAVKDGSTINAKTTDKVSGQEISAESPTPVPTPEAPSVAITDKGAEITPPRDAEAGDKVVVNYVDENGNPASITLTKGNDGLWSSPDSPFPVDKGIGKVTIPTDKFKQNSTVKAQTISGVDPEKISEEVSDTNPIPQSPAISIDPETNDVTITLPADNVEEGDETTIRYVDEHGQKQVVQYKYVGGVWTPIGGAAELTDGKLLLSSDRVQSGTDNIITSTKDAVSGIESKPNIDGKNPLPVAPDIEPKADGSVTITLPEKNVEEGDKVAIEFIAPNGETVSVEFVYTDDGWAVVGNLPEGVAFDPESPATLTLADSVVKDGSKVTATTTDKISGEEFPNKEDTLIPTPSAPTVEITSAGAEITPPNDAEIDDKVVVSYIKADGTEGSITLVKGDDGNWTSPDSTYPVDPTSGKVIIPTNDFQKGSPTKAKTISGADPSKTSEEASDVNPIPESPSVTRDDSDNSITITMPKDNVEEGDVATITFKDPEGNEVTYKYKLDENGEWQPVTENGVTPPALTKKADGSSSLTLSNDQVKSGENVSATTTDAISNTTSEPNSASKNPLPEAPTITPNDDGSVTVELPSTNVEEGDKVTVEFIRPDGTTDKVVLTKTGDSWTGKLPDGVTLNENGTLTLSDDAVDDNSQITGKTTDAISGQDFPAEAKTSVTPPATPPIVAGTEEGYVVVPPKDAEPGDQVVITYNDKNGVEQTMTLTKSKTDGTWKMTEHTGSDKISVDPETGKVVFPPELVEQDTPITATSIPEGDPSNLSKQATESLNTINLPPKGLEVIANGNDGDALGAGTVTVNLPTVNVEEGDQVVVTRIDPYTKQDVTIILTRNAANAWEMTTDGAQAGLTLSGDTLTLADTLVRDGEPLNAYIIDGKAGKEATEKLFNDYNATKTDEADKAVVSASDNAKNTMPTLTLNTDQAAKVVTITAAETLEAGDKIQIKWEGPEGQSYVVVATKGTDGNFTLENMGYANGDSKITPNGNSFTVPSTAIHDNAKVTATPLNREATVGEEAGKQTSEKINDDISAPAYTAEADGIAFSLPSNASYGNTLTISGNFILNGTTENAELKFVKKKTNTDEVTWELDADSVPAELAGLAEHIHITPPGNEDHSNGSIKIKYENIAQEQVLEMVSKGANEFDEKFSDTINIPKLAFSNNFTNPATKGSLAIDVGQYTNKVVLTFTTEDTLMSFNLIDDANQSSEFGVNTNLNADGTRYADNGEDNEGTNINHAKATIRTVTLERYDASSKWRVVSDTYEDDAYDADSPNTGINHTHRGQFLSVATDANGNNLVGAFDNETEGSLIGNTIVIEPNGVMGNTQVSAQVYNSATTAEYYSSDLENAKHRLADVSVYSGEETPTPDYQTGQDGGGFAKVTDEVAYGSYVVDRPRNNTIFELVEDNVGKASSETVKSIFGESSFSNSNFTATATSFKEQVTYASDGNVLSRLFFGTRSDGVKIAVKLTKLPLYIYSRRDEPAEMLYEVHQINDDGTSIQLAKRIFHTVGNNGDGVAYWDPTGIGTAEGGGRYIVVSNNVTFFTPGTFKAGTELQVFTLNRDMTTKVYINEDAANYNADSVNAMNIPNNAKMTSADRNDNRNLIADYGNGVKMYAVAGGYVPVNLKDNISSTKAKITNYGTTEIQGYKTSIIVPEDTDAPIEANTATTASPFLSNDQAYELTELGDTVSYSTYFSDAGLVAENVATKLHAKAGNDTLIIDVDGVSVATSQFTGVEQLDVVSQDVTLNVKASDLVTNHSEIPLHINGDNTTKVDLGANNTDNPTADLRDADGLWAKQESVVENDTTYDVYRHSSTSQTVYIQQEVEVI